MDYKYRYLSFLNDRNQRIAAKVYYPVTADPARRFPGAIFAHGFAADYRDLEHYGPTFARNGIIMLLFDFCGGSRTTQSEGQTTEMSVLTEEADYADVLRQFAAMGQRGELPLDPGRIWLMGESQGGYVAALTASRHPDEAAGLVLWYPAFCLGDMSLDWKRKTRNGYTVEMWGVPLGRCYTDDILKTDIYAEIADWPKPTLIIHGDADDTVDLTYSLRAQKIMQQVQLHIIKGAGHGFEGEECTEAAEASMKFISVK